VVARRIVPALWSAIVTRRASRLQTPGAIGGPQSTFRGTTPQVLRRDASLRQCEVASSQRSGDDPIPGPTQGARRLTDSSEGGRVVSRRCGKRGADGGASALARVAAHRDRSGEPARVRGRSGRSCASTAATASIATFSDASLRSTQPSSSMLRGNSGFLRRDVVDA
jgi:hypothetical protein